MAMSRLHKYALLSLLTALLTANPAHAGKVSVVREAIPDLPLRYIYFPDNLAKLAKPAPVIVWANGGCSRNDQDWVPLYERWAKAGYVVLTVSTPDAKPRTREVFESYRNMPPPKFVPRSGPPLAPGQLEGGANDAVDFQSTAIDWVAKTQQSDSKFRGRLDPSRIAAAGNSCGGIASLHLAAKDPRVKAVYILSGSVNPVGTPESNAQVLSTVMVPTIWIVGGPEDIARPNAESDFKLMPAKTPVVLIRRDSFDHPQMTYEPEIRRDAGEIGVAWFDAILRNDTAATRLLGTKGCKTCNRAHWRIETRNFEPRR